jgi:hypothetical protein
VATRPGIASRSAACRSAASSSCSAVRVCSSGMVSTTGVYPAACDPGDARRSRARRSISDSATCDLQPKTRRESRRHSASRGALVSASQIPARARATGDGSPLFAVPQDQTAVNRQAGVRPGWWRRLCLSSFVLAGITVCVLWVAVAGLLRQGLGPLWRFHALHHSQEELSVLTSDCQALTRSFRAPLSPSADRRSITAGSR